MAQRLLQSLARYIPTVAADSSRSHEAAFRLFQSQLAGPCSAAAPAAAGHAAAQRGARHATSLRDAMWHRAPRLPSTLLAGAAPRSARSCGSRPAALSHALHTARRALHTSAAPLRQPWQVSNLRGFRAIPPEYVVYGMMGINAAVFGAWQVACMRNFMYAHFTSSYRHLRGGYLHTLLTNSVSHQSLGHLFTNMFTFYFFGQGVVQYLGVARVRFCAAHDVSAAQQPQAAASACLTASSTFHACRMQPKCTASYQSWPVCSSCSSTPPPRSSGRWRTRSQTSGTRCWAPPPP